jgi:hypothetical protein
MYQGSHPLLGVKPAKRSNREHASRVPPSLTVVTMYSGIPRCCRSDMARSFYSECRYIKNTLIKRELGVVLSYPTYKQALTAQHEEEVAMAAVAAAAAAAAAVATAAAAARCSMCAQKSTVEDDNGFGSCWCEASSCTVPQHAAHVRAPLLLPLSPCITPTTEGTVQRQWRGVGSLSARLVWRRREGRKGRGSTAATTPTKHAHLHCWCWWCWWCCCCAGRRATDPADSAAVGQWVSAGCLHHQPAQGGG